MAFEEWLSRHFGIERINGIKKDDVGKIKAALKAMVRQEAGSGGKKE
jgi:hypothetical protein